MTCDNCSNEISSNPIIKAGRKFCAPACLEAYKFPQHITSIGASELLSAEEIRTIEVSQNTLICEMNHEELINHIASIKRHYQELRARERITHSKLNKLVALGETEKTERYRKLGVNSDLEAKKKVYSVVQKEIIRYRKMSIPDEKIKQILISDLEVESEKVEIAFKEL